MVKDQGWCLDGSRAMHRTDPNNTCCKLFPKITNNCVLAQSFCHQRDYMDHCNSYVCISHKGHTKTVLQEHAQHLVSTGCASYLHCGLCGKCSYLKDSQL